MGVKALEKLDTIEVSLVRSGANRRRFAIFKTESDMDPEVIQAVLETEFDGEGDQLAAILKADASPKARAAMKAILRAHAGFKDEIPANIVNVKALMKALGLKEMHDKDEDKMATKKAAPASQPEATLKSDDLAALPPALAAKVEALWKANGEKDKAIEALSLTVKAERDERRVKEFTALAQSDFDNLGDSAEVGAVLKSISDTDEGLYTRVESIFKAAQARIAEAPAFQEVGRKPGRAETLSGAESRMAAAVKEIVTKSAGKVDEPGAWEVIMRERPELYDDYLAEKGGR